MRDWQETTLGKIAIFSTEKVCASKVSPENYISTDNMLVNCGGVLKADTVPKSSKFNQYKETDTLFSNIRTYFKKVWLSDRRGGASPDVLIFRSIDQCTVDPIYLYYTLSNQLFIDYTVLTSKGAKMPRGDKAAIMKYTIGLPEITEQKAIASMLRALDDKIELNRRMNATLESMARALFKSWFVDFDPVRAKMEGKQPFGMDAATAALFPSRLVPSPLGDIPEGWSIVPVIDSAEFINGAAYKNMHFSNAPDALPVIKIAELKNGKDSGIQQLLSAALSKDEKTSFEQQQFGKILWIQRQLESKILSALHKIISGEDFVTPSIEQLRIIQDTIAKFQVGTGFSAPTNRRAA